MAIDSFCSKYLYFIDQSLYPLLSDVGIVDRGERLKKFIGKLGRESIVKKLVRHFLFSENLFIDKSDDISSSIKFDSPKVLPSVLI